MVVKLDHKRWKYFSEEELRCKGTGELKMMEEFMSKLIELRKKLGQPMVISSGYRTPEYNQRI
jgi:zinc D-Ala-D-Ala carboxypeptidase